MPLRRRTSLVRLRRSCQWRVLRPAVRSPASADPLSSCRFGGERPWFVCDVHANGVYCGRRVAKLYGAGRLFACRHCYRLGVIQRDGPMDQAHHRLRRLHRKLGADYDGPDGMPPERPKWMRQRTYDRVVQQIEAGEDRLDHVFMVGMQRLLAEVDKLERRGGMRR